MVKVLACFFICLVENPVFGSNMGRIFQKRKFRPIFIFPSYCEELFLGGLHDCVCRIGLSNDGIHLFLEFVKRSSARPYSHCCYGSPEIVFTHVAYDPQLLLRP